MNIRQGEVFENSTDGVDFIVKKIVKDMEVIRITMRMGEILKVSLSHL